MSNNQKDRSGAIGCITGILCFAGFILLMLLIDSIVEKHNEELYDRIGDSAFPLIYLIASVLISFGLIPWLFSKRAKEREEIAAAQERQIASNRMAAAAAKIDWQEMNRRIVEIMKNVEKNHIFRIQNNGIRVVAKTNDFAHFLTHPALNWIQLEVMLDIDEERRFLSSFGPTSYRDRAYADIFTEPTVPQYYGDHLVQVKTSSDPEITKWFDAHGSVQVYEECVSLVFVLTRDDSIPLEEFVKHIDFSNPYISRVKPIGLK
jgi:hypothetical protein